MRRRRLALLAPKFAAACTSIPVSTMWKLARFDLAASLAIDPTQRRAAALVDQRASMEDFTMKVTLTPKDGKPSDYSIPLTAPGSTLTLVLSTREGAVPPELAPRFPLRLDLILDAQDGWFTALKDSELDLT